MEYVSLTLLVAHFYFCQESDKKGTEQKRPKKGKGHTFLSDVWLHTQNLFFLSSLFLLYQHPQLSKTTKVFCISHRSPLHTGQQSCLHAICTVYSISRMTTQGNGLQSHAQSSEVPQLNYQLSVRRGETQRETHRQRKERFHLESAYSTESHQKEK